MAPVIFINIKNGTTIIHNITTLQMFPSKGDVLHIPYGSYRSRQRETSDSRKSGHNGSATPPYTDQRICIINKIISYCRTGLLTDTQS